MTESSLTAPSAGGRMRLTPTGDGSYRTQRLPLADPLAGATDAERAFYLAHYDGVPLAELMRRLRLAEWNAERYQRQAAALERQAKEQPPAYRFREMADRLSRVRALLDVPRRRVIPKADLADALDTPGPDAATP